MLVIKPCTSHGENKKMIYDSNNNPLTTDGLRHKDTSRARRLRLYLALGGLLLILLLTAAAYATFIINLWFNEHTIKWQSPIQTPLRVEQRYGSPVLSLLRRDNKPESTTGLDIRSGVIKEAEASDVSSEPITLRTIEQPNKIDIHKIVATVYQLESSSGKHDACRNNNRGYNGYGYRYNNMEKKCFTSHEEVTALVQDWFIEKLKKHDLATSLCGYNLGFSSPHLHACVNSSSAYPYYKNFLKLQ